MTPKQCSSVETLRLSGMSWHSTSRVWPSFNTKCVAEQFLVPTYEARHQDLPSLHFGLKDGKRFVKFCLQVYKDKFLKATEQTAGCGPAMGKGKLGYGMGEHIKNKSSNSLVLFGIVGTGYIWLFQFK